MPVRGSAGVREPANKSETFSAVDKTAFTQRAH